MRDETITVDKVVISEEGISIPPTRHRNGKFIAWDDVQNIRSYKNSLRVQYTTLAGNIRTVLIGKGKKEPGKALLRYWKNVLVKHTATKGYLSGSIYLEKWPLQTGLILGSAASVYLVYAMWIAIKAYLHVPLAMKQIAAWVAYYGSASFGIVLLCILASLSNFIQLSRIKSKWNTWKISRSGLFIQRESGQWENVRFRPGDRVSNHEIVIGGEHVPYKFLTRNIIVPYLLGILAKQQGISAVPGKGSFFKGAIRLIVFWPFVIAMFWYLPFLLWKVPESLDFNIGKTLLIIFGSFIGTGISFLILHVIEMAKYRQEFPYFLSQMVIIQQKLGW